MAQVTFPHLDKDMILNCKASTAITAGDIVYAAGATAEPFGTTVPSGVDYGDIPVYPVQGGTAAEGQYVVGVALSDAATSGAVRVATEGVFLSPAEGTTNITSGAVVRPAYNETTVGVALLAGTGTTTKADNQKWLGQAIGRAITGAETEGHYVLWKLRI